MQLRSLHPTRALLVVLVAVVAGSAFAACGGGGDGKGGTAAGRGSASGGRSRALPLEGTEWVLDQETSTLETVVPSVTVTARFEQGRISGSAGCNGYNAAYTVVGPRLRIVSPVASTLKLCDQPAMNVEAAYTARLPQVRSYAISGRMLTLGTTTKGADLVYRGMSAAEAIEGAWEVTSYFRPGAIVSVALGSTLTADFAAGKVSGDSGCNTYSGPYTTDGSAIAIGPLVSTLRACADPAVGQQETDFLAALQRARSFRLDGAGLTLLREDGGIAVTLSPG